MKAFIVVIVVFFTATTLALAQGILNFATRVTGQVNAPAYIHLVEYKIGSDFWGQLYAAAPGGNLAPVSERTEFRNDAGIGYITSGGTAVVPGVPAGETAIAKVVVWYKGFGSTYEEALINTPCGGTGESSVIEVVTGGGLMPPANLVGLSDIEVGIVCPEASSFRIGILGTGVLLLTARRRPQLQSPPPRQVQSGE